MTVIEQFKIQLYGIVVVGVYAFGVSYLSLKLVNQLFPLRVSLASEMLGLNVSEHNATTETLSLFNEIENHSRQGDFSNPVYVEPFTEVGQIAEKYNQVLSRVNSEISEREQAIDSYKSSESRRDAIMSSALDCIICINVEGIIQEFNPAAEKCFGYIRQRIIKKSFIDYFVPPDKQESFKKNLINGFSIESKLSLNRHNKIILLRMHGAKFNAELTITKIALKNEAIKEFNLHIRDITQQIKIQKKMTQLAYHDSLTGLYNRSYFIKKLQEEIDFARRYRKIISLMFLDLDQFKYINDNLGHKVGDIVLQEVAQRLSRIIRESDVICRWGGDEFILLFIGLSNQQAISDKAKEVLSAMREPYLHHGKELSIRTSIGIAVSGFEQMQQEQLVQQADMALYAAKNKGRNTFCFFVPEMEDQVNKRFHYEAELRIALEQGQFFMVYQPKVDCQNNTIKSMEALIRWNHPKEGFISPAIFIPILEESSLIEEVTQWVLESVCRQIAQWQKEQCCDFYIAVNISGRDFMVNEFDQQISGLLKKHQIQGNCLELEITETVLADKTEQCLIAMHKIKKLGIRFAIDDFGTGYSSMSYLKKFPIDTLKIDKAFIDYCDSKAEDAAICTAIISLGKSLGLQLVAEGVETQSQLQFLKEQDCDLYQGYLFSRPLPIEEIQAFLNGISSE